MNLILTFLFESANIIRVQYDAVTWNEASIKAALRFGFKHEGVCRNLGGIIPDHKKRQGEKHLKSQDLWLSSMTDTEWAIEGKERLSKMCERTPIDTTGLT
jgi:RimJ/RimL family protein N-acetyltransferase